ncbi:DAPG hydrolase family protein [Streptomyces bauhiniae]|uniref:DAPG hydrolase family protein n=1 Tax=Streptomyces bauhiniae TaxID=2340725 RepID=UPI003651492A
MAPLPEHIREAIDRGPQAPPLCLELDDVGAREEAGHQDLEDGYSLFGDGSMHVAAVTHMPRVSPEMVDWWFWHATETQRYKL